MASKLGIIPPHKNIKIGITKLGLRFSLGVSQVYACSASNFSELWTEREIGKCPNTNVEHKS